MTMSTTKAHVGRPLMKLGPRDRAQLVIAAYEAGLVGQEGLATRDYRLVDKDRKKIL